LWRLHELDPELTVAPSALTYKVHREATSTWLETQCGTVAELARDELADITRLSENALLLEKRIRGLVRRDAPTLLAMPGRGPLSAAKIIAETASVARFPTEAAFARFAGVAPTPAWSGSTQGRIRYVKSGNRQINTALHRIAMTQLRDGAGQVYYRKRIEMGDPPMAALRLETPPRARGVQPHESRQRDDVTSPPDTHYSAATLRQTGPPFTNRQATTQPMPNGHTPAQFRLGRSSSLPRARGGGHTTWHCRSCDVMVYGPPLNKHCTCT
jgi:transposase